MSFAQPRYTRGSDRNPTNSGSDSGNVSCLASGATHFFRLVVMAYLSLSIALPHAQTDDTFVNLQIRPLTSDSVSPAVDDTKLMYIT